MQHRFDIITTINFYCYYTGCSRFREYKYANESFKPGKPMCIVGNSRVTLTTVYWINVKRRGCKYKQLKSRFFTPCSVKEFTLMANNSKLDGPNDDRCLYGP